MKRPLRPWIKETAIIILIIAIMVIAFQLISIECPCSKCGAPCVDEIAAAEGWSPVCENCSK